MYGPPMLGPGFIVVIVLAGCATVILKHYFRVRAKEAESGHKAMVSRAEFDATQAGMARLEERIRVLERIVTDRGERLSREIDELR